MRGREDFFLSQSRIEELSLFRRIVNARASQTPVAERLAIERTGEPLVTEVNLKQIAALTKRNYGAVYNTYNSLVATLAAVLGVETTAVRKLFNVSSSTLRWALVREGHPYHFLKTLLYHDYPDFDAFLAAEQTSKATMLRHLKPLREFAREFGVRFSYETLTLQGDEKCIRLFLTMIYWMATDGSAWPFDDLPRDILGAVIDGSVKLFDIGQPNYVTREILMYYIAISQRRANEGRSVPYMPADTVLKYPVANMFDELSALNSNRFHFPVLSTDEQMGESTALYFTFHFLPFYTSTSTRLQAETFERFKRYNPSIYTLVTDFLEKLPVSFLLEGQLPKAAFNMLRANLLANTVSTLQFRGDLSQTIAYAMNQRIAQMPDNPVLERKVRQTLEHVVYTRHLESLQPVMDQLVHSYYTNVQQVAMQFAPPVKVKVAPVIEQTVLGYIDLVGFLMAQPFVEVLSPADDLKAADLIIESAELPDSYQFNAGKLTYKWAASVSNDWYGELYSELRQLWDEKSAIAINSTDFDY